MRNSSKSLSTLTLVLLIAGLGGGCVNRQVRTARDMQVIDTDPSDPFDFFIDEYNAQLVAGFDRNRSNYGLTVYMRDFDDLGKPPRPGEKLAP